MTTLPDNSRANFKEGLWFVHNDGINSIKICCSMTGKEKIFLNEELILENRNFTQLKTEHAIQDQNGNTYTIQFIAKDIIKGEMDCLIFRNEELIKSFHTTFRRGDNFSFKRLAIILFASANAAIIKIMLGLPDYLLFIFFALIFIVDFSLKDKGEILITEE